MKLIKQLVFALFMGLSLFSATGCASALGFGIGALADSKCIKKMGIPNEQATLIPNNSKIKIFLKNGKTLEGKFIMRTEQQVGDKYLESIVWYDKENDRQVSTQVADIERIATINYKNGKWRSFEEAATIPINSPIQIFLKNGEQQEGKFLLRKEHQVGDDVVESIFWHDKANNQQVSTQIADIERIVAKPKQNGKLVGLAIGGAIDAIMVVGALNSAFKDFDFGF